jgi:hypothetical protein
MRDDEREHARGDDVRSEPAEPAKVHGDVLEDLIPRDLREPDPGDGTDDDAARARRERSPKEG